MNLHKYLEKNSAETRKRDTGRSDRSAENVTTTIDTELKTGLDELERIVNRASEWDSIGFPRTSIARWLIVTD